MSNVHADITKLLTRTTKPLTAAELSERFHMPERVVYAHIGKLRVQYRQQLVSVKVGRYLGYRIDAARAKEKQKPAGSVLALPADLWRGWINPATGYQPAKLGL